MLDIDSCCLGSLCPGWEALSTSQVSVTSAFSPSMRFSNYVGPIHDTSTLVSDCEASSTPFQWNPTCCDRPFPSPPKQEGWYFAWEPVWADGSLPGAPSPGIMEAGPLPSGGLRVSMELCMLVLGIGRPPFIHDKFDCVFGPCH